MLHHTPMICFNSFVIQSNEVIQLEDLCPIWLEDRYVKHERWKKCFILVSLAQYILEKFQTR